tara:strand:+ start:11 stop:502 length:492 start_codon:yes stop_codon:yes gene_type:complete
MKLLLENWRKFLDERLDGSSPGLSGGKPFRTDPPQDVSPELVAAVMEKLPRADVDTIMNMADDQGLFDGILKEKLIGDIPTGTRARYRPWDKNDPFSAVRATFDPETKKRTYREPLAQYGSPLNSYYVFDEKPEPEHVVHMIRRLNILARRILFDLLDKKGVF